MVYHRIMSAKTPSKLTYAAVSLFNVISTISFTVVLADLLVFSTLSEGLGWGLLALFALAALSSHFWRFTVPEMERGGVFPHVAWVFESVVVTALMFGAGWFWYSNSGKGFGNGDYSGEIILFGGAWLITFMMYGRIIYRVASKLYYKARGDRRERRVLPAIEQLAVPAIALNVWLVYVSRETSPLIIAMGFLITIFTVLITHGSRDNLRKEESALFDKNAPVTV
jgi:hypothetical protein